MPRAAILPLLILLLSAPAFPQATSPPRPAGPAGAPRALPALSRFIAAARGDTLADTLGDAPRGTKSSWTAVGLSAALPGAGQVYTENYWKVPIILGLGGYWVWEWNRNDDRYQEFRDLYSESVAQSPPFGDERLLSLREAYKDQRDSFAWYLGILYLLNVVDAYVGAELYGFDVGPDLGAGGGGAVATFRLRL